MGMIDKINISFGWEHGYASHENSVGSLWGGEVIPVLEPAVKELRARDVRTVVDVGCGDGRNLLGLCQAGFACTGVDISPTALERAGNHLRSQNQSAFFVEASLTDLPFAAESVEAVTAFDVFGQVPDSTTAITEFARVLRPGSVIILNAFSTEDDTYGEGERVGRHVFNFKDTTFRYFEHDELVKLFADRFDLLKVDPVAWNDPPHGDFRPYPHRHVNWFVIARSKGLSR